MPTILPFDDLEAGRFVTVHSVRTIARRVRRRSESPFEDGDQEVHLHLGGPSGPVPPPGVPLKILALNAPFLMVITLRPGGEGEGPIYLDSRGVQLMAVPSAMVEALRALKPRHAGASVDDGSEDDEGLPF